MGGGEQCVIWQQMEKWKIRGVVFTRCVESEKESIMGCRLIKMVALCSAGLSCPCGKLRFAECSSEPQGSLRNYTYTRIVRVRAIPCF